MFFGNIKILGRYVFQAEILIEGGDEDYLLYALNFMTFGIMSQKLWPNIVCFFVNRQSGHI